VLRVGVPDPASRRFGGDALSEAAYDLSLGHLIALGAELKPVDLSPHFAVASLLYDGAWVAERYQAIRPFLESRPDALHPVTRAITERALGFSAADAFAGLYRLAALKRTAEAIWRDIDVLLVPTFPRPRSLAELEVDPIGANSELGSYTNFVNLLDLCALAVPAAPRADGLPAGLTLIAPAGQDGVLATLGSHLHRAARLPLGATGAVLAPAPALPTPPEDGRIEIAVVGAHLSGLALNRELLDRGACFVRQAVTRPDYRLFALSAARCTGPACCASPRAPAQASLARSGRSRPRASLASWRLFHRLSASARSASTTGPSQRASGRGGKHPERSGHLGPWRLARLPGGARSGLGRAQADSWSRGAGACASRRQGGEVHVVRAELWKLSGAAPPWAMPSDREAAA
jgi:allophanate hydrolase